MIFADGSADATAGRAGMERALRRSIAAILSIADAERTPPERALVDAHPRVVAEIAAEYEERAAEPTDDDSDGVAYVSTSNPAAKARERDMLESAIEDFLDDGGEVVFFRPGKARGDRKPLTLRVAA